MFKLNYEIFCAKKGVAPTAVLRAIGLSNAAYSTWTENSIPRKTTLLKLSEYFGVSIDELLSDNPPQMQENMPKEEFLSKGEFDSNETTALNDSSVLLPIPNRLDASLEIMQKLSTLDDYEVNALLTIVRSMGGK